MTGQKRKKRRRKEATVGREKPTRCAGCSAGWSGDDCSLCGSNNSSVIYNSYYYHNTCNPKDIHDNISILLRGILVRYDRCNPG